MTTITSKRQISAFLALLAAPVAFAQDTVPCSQTVETEAYPTELEAVTAALTGALHTSHTVEYGGAVVLMPDGSYRYTEAVTQNRATDLNFSIRTEGKVVAIYHTHPAHGFEGGSAAATDFSPLDIKVAKKTGYRSYIAVWLDKSVRLLSGSRETLLTHISGGAPVALLVGVL